MEEIVELAKIVGKHGGIYTTHIRNEADEPIASVEETIHIAKEANVRTNISHMKVLSRPHMYMTVHKRR